MLAGFVETTSPGRCKSSRTLSRMLGCLFQVNSRENIQKVAYASLPYFHKMARKLYHDPNQLEFRLDGNAGSPSLSPAGITRENARKRARSELGKGRYLLDRVDRSRLPELSMQDSIRAAFVAGLIDQSVPMDDESRRVSWNHAKHYFVDVYSENKNNLPYFFAFLVGVYDAARDGTVHPTSRVKRKSFIGWLANGDPHYDIAQYPGLEAYLSQE